MADTLNFELVSPARLLKSEAVEMVVVPGVDGDVGVLPGHSLLIGTVRPGVIDIHENGKVKEKIFVAGGFAEVTPERCTVLAEEAMPVSDLTVEAADARQKAADEADDEAGRKIAAAMRAAMAN
ncbi:MAG: ATP synthase F1 subunit epsilon [Rhodospirillales bacterium]